ncbi:hypothetical protein TRVA0_001S01442 [Trichomonascus vanleenenianus]|uniref:uncharacterized protein n=1 Tax=Trichomonascus vanleenenianus TaxID=2268995 RepID=UPI003EC9DECD
MLNRHSEAIAEEWRRKLVGKLFIPQAQLTRQAAGNPNVVSERHLPQPFRVLRPGMAATMDYRPNRLNVMLDQAGRIVNVNYA